MLYTKSCHQVFGDVQISLALVSANFRIDIHKGCMFLDFKGDISHFYPIFHFIMLYGIHTLEECECL